MYNWEDVAGMWEVILGIRHRGCPVSDTSAKHPAVHVENLSKGQHPDGGAKRLLSLRGSEEQTNAFVADFRAHDSGIRFERIPGGSDEVAYYTADIEYESDNPSMLSVMYANGCYQHSSVSVREGVETWKLYTETKPGVHELIADVEERDNDVRTYQSRNLGEIDDAASMEFESLATRLTARQRTVLEAALQHGYYDPDSEVTTETIGEELDLHQSTVWEHLSKAENAVLTEVGRHLFSTVD